jgi:Ala-tRNA(Pro) deacylase
MIAFIKPLKTTTMPVKKLKSFLDENNVKYVMISHSNAYTSQEIAASAHISGKELAKTVMIEVDGKMAMAVLPATNQIDFDNLRKILGTKDVILASESVFKDLFPDCDPGAMPPFGNLYGMKVFVDDSLLQDHEIAFNAGSHTELIRLSYSDYERLVKPGIFRFSWKEVSVPRDPEERWKEDL